MKAFTAFAMLLLSTASFARPQMISCENAQEDVAVTLVGPHFDQVGKYFEGEVVKDGVVVRTTVLRQAFVSNYFSLYSPKKGGWSINNDTGASKEMQLMAESSSMQRTLGAYAVNLKCNKSVPENWK